MPNSVIWIALDGESSRQFHQAVKRRGRTILFAPYQRRCPPLNILQTYGGDALERNQLADQTEALFARLNPRSWGPHIADALRFGTLAALEFGAKTRRQVSLWEVYRVLSDEAFRDQVMDAIWDRALLDFLATDPNKAAVSQLRRIMANSALVRVLGRTGGLNLLEIMGSGKILIADLDAGKLGEKTAEMFGQLLAAKIQNAVYYRRKGIDTPAYVFLDEFHRYANSSMATMLEQSRKYDVSLTLACQSMAQATDTIRAALGQVGSRYIFRPEEQDAKAIGRLLGIDDKELLEIPNRACYIRELKQGHVYAPRLVRTPPPIWRKADVSKGRRHNRGRELRRVPLPATVREAILRFHRAGAAGLIPAGQGEAITTAPGGGGSAEHLLPSPGPVGIDRRAYGLGKRSLAESPAGLVADGSDATGHQLRRRRPGAGKWPVASGGGPAESWSNWPQGPAV